MLPKNRYRSGSGLVVETLKNLRRKISAVDKRLIQRLYREIFCS